jgi:two-component system CheB/CheR fusion protein
MSEGFALCDAIRGPGGALTDYTVAEINPAMQAILGTVEIKAGTRLSETGMGGPAWLELCDGVLRTGAPVIFEFNAPGSERWYEIRLNRVTGERLAQFLFDITQRKAAEERQDLLLREMNHRIKNLFAVMNGVVVLTSRSAASAKDMAEAIRGRLEALARAHELVLPRSHRDEGAAPVSADLGALAHAVLLPYANPAGPRAGGEPRLTIEGATVRIGENAANALALILHELATNAVKYGALARAGGRVRVGWGEENGRLRLSWRERGGPRLGGPPGEEGFGSLLARRSVAAHLGGEITHAWNTAGLEVDICAPLERLAT